MFVYSFWYNHSYVSTYYVLLLFRWNSASGNYFVFIYFLFIYLFVNVRQIVSQCQHRLPRYKHFAEFDQFKQYTSNKTKRKKVWLTNISKAKCYILYQLLIENSNNIVINAFETPHSVVTIPVHVWFWLFLRPFWVLLRYGKWTSWLGNNWLWCHTLPGNSFKEFQDKISPLRFLYFLCLWNIVVYLPWETGTSTKQCSAYLNFRNVLQMQEWTKCSSF